MTVVTREAEWDETTRARALELDRYQARFCPCGCGQLLEHAADPKRAFRVQKHVCHARRAIDKHRADEEARAEKEHRPDGWDAGTTYFIDESFVIDPQGGVKRG